MASGDPVLQIIDVMYPGSNPATPDVRAGGSTPAENVSVWDFDASTAEYLDFKVILRGYDSGGLTMFLPYSMSSATSGNVVWRAAFRRVQDDAEDIDGSHTYDYNSTTDAVASASGELSYPTITFTDGADMDSFANGEVAILRVGRDAANGSDTATGDAELWAVEGRET